MFSEQPTYPGCSYCPATSKNFLGLVNSVISTIFSIVFEQKYLFIGGKSALLSRIFSENQEYWQFCTRYCAKIHSYCKVHEPSLICSAAECS